MSTEVPTDVSDAIDRLQNYYNTSQTESEGSLIGPDGNGHRVNFIPSIQDVGLAMAFWAALAPTLVVTPDSSILGIVALTQGEYDALPEKDAATLYVIKAA